MLHRVQVLGLPCGEDLLLHAGVTTVFLWMGGASMVAVHAAASSRVAHPAGRFRIGLPVCCYRLVAGNLVGVAKTHHALSSCAPPNDFTAR